MTGLLRQQKLLALACCIATEAHILLLDEPIAGVHPDMAERILGPLEQLREAGKLIAQGQPNEVLERPEIMEAFAA